MSEPYDHGYREGMLCRKRRGLIPPESQYPAGTTDDLSWWIGYCAGWLDTCNQLEREAAALTPRQEMIRG